MSTSVDTEEAGPADSSDGDGDGHGNWYGDRDAGHPALLNTGAKDTCLFLRGDTGRSVYTIAWAGS